MESEGKGERVRWGRGEATKNCMKRDGEGGWGGDVRVGMTR